MKEPDRAALVKDLPPLPVGASRARSDHKQSPLFPATRPEPAKPGTDGASEPISPSAFEPIEVARQRIDELVGEVSVPKKLDQQGGVVGRLLREDELRRTEARYPAHATSDTPPKFESAIERRRLRFLGAFIGVMERLGCDVKGSTHAGERFCIVVAGVECWVRIFVDRLEPATRGHWQAQPRQRRASEWIRLDLIPDGGSYYVEDYQRVKPERTWQEEDGERIEDRFGEIVREFLLIAEKRTRAATERWYRHRLEGQARQQREARAEAERVAEEARRAEQERAKQQAAAARRRQDLLREAADIVEAADRIRRFIDMAMQRRVPDASTDAAFAAWQAWATKEADALQSAAMARLAEQVESFKQAPMVDD
ncbi:hypothetical protein [Siccirubricoccus phaeus]|uniref:hypothetical protein n=1 Tax=Siccirubricoccus phaeus TaxID=2595053 RepID=UPI0011F165FA|nr:hypothetical protein [Siccirubricoccus phaeus]